MCCSSRPSRAKKSVVFRRLAKLVFLLLAVPAASTLAQAQIAVAPPPPPPPLPVPTDINSDVSSGAAVADLGSSFLERLGNQATGGFNRNSRTNPGGGGASEAAQGPQFRAWGEAYGISATTGPLGFYVGDHRQTWGGVAGIGARVAPGVNVGFSVDQSRTAIDVPLAFQSATLDLTQLGGDFLVDFLLVIEIISQRRVYFRGFQVGMLPANLIRGPAKSEIIHDDLRHPYSGNPSQASWLPLLLFDVRMA